VRPDVVRHFVDAALIAFVLAIEALLVLWFVVDDDDDGDNDDDDDGEDMIFTIIVLNRSNKSINLRMLSSA